MPHATEKCPTCGTTTMHFDPPVELDIQDECGALKPGTYSHTTKRGALPICGLAKGHEGKHMAFIEYVDDWEV